MGNFLDKLGVHAFTHKWRYITGWVVILTLLGIGAFVYMKPTSSALTIPGTKAQVALDRANELFPDLGSGSGRVVVATSDGKVVDEYKSTITDLTQTLSKVEGVERAISPFENPMAVSEERQVAYIQLQLDKGQGSVSDGTISAVEAAVSKARDSGLTVEMGGDIINKAPGQILGIGEVGGVVIALFVLVLALGSIVAAGLPIIVALVTIGVSMAGLFSLSQVLDINATTPVLAVMLGLAVGIDYSLFIVNKYRVLAKRGMSYQRAAGKAVGTAGNAVIFAAATVVIALAALSIIQIPFITMMGLTGAATIALAAIVAVTLVPALLGVVGDKLFRSKTRQLVAVAQKKKSIKADVNKKHTIWYRWGVAVTKRPVVVLAVSLVFVGALAWPIQDLRLGLPTDEYAAVDSTERKAYDLLSQGFGVGFNGPLLVVAEGLPAATAADQAAVKQQMTAEFESRIAAETQKQQALFAEKAAAVTTQEQAMQLQQEAAAAEVAGGAARESALRSIEEQALTYASLRQAGLVATDIQKDADVAQAVPVMATSDGTKALLQVTPVGAPSDQSTIELIERLRDRDVGGVNLGVTGGTALQTDINQKLGSALPVYLGIVVGLSLILLIVAFRSILIPIKATLGFLLSVIVMFGCLVAVFQWGWFGIAEAPGPIVSFIPIIAVGILFGLAMDYEFFLVSSMHEAYRHGDSAKQAVINGFGQGAKVVAAACVIMVAVFAGFIFNHDATIKAIGFGLAVGILIDALLVRMTIVPAIMTLLGKHAWWLPAWLDKRLPHISIEGESDEPTAKGRR